MSLDDKKQEQSSVDFAEAKEKGLALYGEKQYNKAISYLQIAAEGGDAESQHYMGVCCLNGRGVVWVGATETVEAWKKTVPRQ